MQSEACMRDLHRRLYEAVWTWGGRQRSRETNIGVAREQISVALRSARILPFVDGNGRTTRLLEGLIFLAAQEEGEVFACDWDVDRDTYIRLLRDYDGTLDPTGLTDFSPVVRFGDLQ